MKKFQLFSYLFVFMTLACFSCKQDGGDFEINYYSPEDYQMMSQSIDIPKFPMDYTNKYPDYYRGGTTGTFDADMATLGRVLFYDKKLSADESISCASCHKQELAFADDVDLSIGIEERRTGRNSLALGAVFNFQEYYGSASFGAVPFFWDNRAVSVQEQSIQTFAADNEMGMEMHEVVTAVKDLEYYKPLFKMAYGDDNISDERVLDAINVFVSSIGSFNSKYDKALDKAGFQLFGFGNNEPPSSISQHLTADEFKGFELYRDNCGSCHGTVNGVPGKISANNGLAISYEDNGEGDLSNSNSDMGKFKVPTLRNIMLTGPYMHDGSLATMDDVLDHYSNGIQLHPNLDSELKSGNSARQMNFSAEDKENLITFFNTFTDDEFLTDERYSDPFKN